MAPTVISEEMGAKPKKPSFLGEKNGTTIICVHKEHMYHPSIYLYIYIIIRLCVSNDDDDDDDDGV